MDRDVTVLGSANADIRVVVDRPPERGTATVAHDLEVGPGGIGLNQAVAAARMGARTTFIGAVGLDDHGAMLVRCLVEAGVEPCVDEVEGATGAAMIALDAEGQITVIEIPGANATLDVLSDRARHVLAHTGVLLVQLEVPVAGSRAAARIVKGQGGSVVLNAVPTADEAEALLPLVDVVVADEPQAAAITDLPGASPETLAAALAQRVPAAVVLGADRVTVLADGAGVRSLPAIVAHALDSSAVTDTFCGAFAQGLSAGEGIDSAAARAAAAAALALQRPGSAQSIPSGADVEAFLALRDA
ncbi:PfkB family carbohydrate kinase [Demequina gelatinilytica]|uniref:PfkB family carbohydrate kinase n=1 Tax=Demequina gelatinilytica TaxID=1638980 RepID=UPI000784CBBD|nr:PfkB family carbohydrate kinase [Demequina gelatinilytica]